MKNIIAILFVLQTSSALKIVAKSSDFLPNDQVFNNSDSTKKPIIVLGGGFLLSPIEIEKPATKTKKANQINFTSPLIATAAGTLLISSSIKRAQTDWYNQTQRGNETSIDDVLAFVPNTLAFGLDIVGIKAKHSFKDRLLIASMANGIMLGLVNGLKFTTNIIRPDKSTKDSFPSGHTAMAFTGAQIMHEEYGHKNIAYSIGGYAIGASTGYLRMVNNRHWVSDVVAGAGIGMLSTKLAYKLLPWAKKKVFKSENLTVLPNYLPKGGGIAMNFTF